LGSSGTSKGQLVEGEAFTSGLDDASAGTFGETQSANREFGDLQQARVVGDGSDTNNDLAFVALSVTDESGKRHGGSVGARHQQTVEDDFVEFRASPSGEELVELDQQTQIGVITPGVGPNPLFLVFVNDGRQNRYMLFY